ncbi:MAG: chemotaxis protein CheC [Clostridiales bacterium]|nr:chemotaxis protein CheC [Clostridiales bacterium]
MPDELGNIGEQGIDTFRELGNIGAGNAATALATILNMQISMSVPEVAVVPFDHIINILSGPENLVAGILVNMSGDLNGYILMILELKDACGMTSMALQREKPPGQELTLDELDRSTLTEIANILVGSYLSAIGAMTGLTITPSVPQMAVDMVGAIISIVLIEYGKIGDSVLFLKTKFSDVHKSMNGHFFLIPDFESYKILMKSLGL